MRENKVDKATIVLHVEQALQQLHDQAGFAHCDLRIANCFYDPNSSSVFLDDLEYLTPLNDPPPNVSIPESWHPVKNARDLDLKQLEKFRADLVHLN